MTASSPSARTRGDATPLWLVRPIDGDRIDGTSRDALGLPGARVRFTVRGIERILPVQPGDLTVCPPPVDPAPPPLRVVA